MESKLRIICFAIILLLPTFLYPKGYKINCMFFIDGKMPYTLYISDSYFYYKEDSSIFYKRIYFQYTVGEILLEQKDAAELLSLNKNKIITIHFNHIKHNNDVYSYIGDIEVGWLFESYLVIRITNLKNDRYYFAYSTQNFDKAFLYKKEYDMFD